MTDIKELPMTTLPDGIVVATTTVQAFTLGLEKLVAADAAATFELVEMCRTPGHEPFYGTAEVLQRRGFIRADGGIHGDVRAVVLASFTGEGVGLKFTPLI